MVMVKVKFNDDDDCDREYPIEVLKLRSGRSNLLWVLINGS